MKKIIYCFIFLLIFLNSSIIFSQPYGWYAQTSPTTNNLNGIWFADINTGTIVGNAGVILRTTNGGTNWISQNTGSTMHLFAVFFASPNTGWAVGDVGTILKTTNGGTNWVTQTSNSVYQLRSISFQTATTGYVAGWYGTILKTTNGGTNWTTLNTGLTNNLLGVAFTNASTGYAVGWLGAIIGKTNGGTNWSTKPSGTTITLENVNFYNAQTGIVIGEQGRIQKTTNSGVNWTVQTVSSSYYLMWITTPLNSFSTIVGEQGLIRITTNAGTNWYTQTSNTSYYLNGISYPDTLNGWAVGDYGTIIHTTTGGWLLPTTPALASPANSATCVPLTVNLDWNDVFPPSCYYRIQISTNSNFTSFVINRAGLVNSNFVIPADSVLNNTQYYWRVIPTNQVGTGPASGTRSFTTVNATPFAPVLVSPANNSTGILLTPMLDWDSVASASTFRIRISADSTFTTSLIDTSGLTISQYQVPAGKLLNNTKYYWRVNASNTCVSSAWSSNWNFRTLIISGVFGFGNESPKEFKLYNNYPNPFNPVTVIMYSIPVNSNVQLKVYDIQGKEISTLVNEFQMAGTYEIQFPNNKITNYQLPSGTYFYKIKAGNFEDVKRMLMIK